MKIKIIMLKYLSIILLFSFCKITIKKQPLFIYYYSSLKFKYAQKHDILGKYECFFHLELYFC